MLTAISTRADSIDSFVRTEMVTRHIPGLPLVVVKNRKIVRASNYGLANVELKVPVNERTSVVYSA